MPSEKDILSRALGRLGHVPPEALEASRQRVRGNLKRALRPSAPLPQPDATPADLTVVRRPFYVAGATALLCLLIVGGAIVRVRRERQSASAPLPKSASVQTSQSQASVPSPLSIIEQRPSVKPSFPKRNKRQPSRAAARPPAPDPLPVESPRPQARFMLLPPGAGKVILDRACGACHRAASVGGYHYDTRAQYADVVSRMIAMGAQISEQEAIVLTDYLFDNLGTKPDRGVESAGHSILERACTVCHSLNGIENYSYDSEEPYRELVSTMVSYGATLSEAEKATLIRYLFTTYGKR